MDAKTAQQLVRTHCQLAHEAMVASLREYLKEIYADIEIRAREGQRNYRYTGLQGADEKLAPIAFELTQLGYTVEINHITQTLVICWGKTNGN